MEISQDYITRAENYFFKKGTKEVKHFAKLKDYKDCTKEKDGVLYFTGRILDGQEVTSVENNISDLGPLTFVKPILDRYSPLSYSIMVYSHQSLALHRNVSSTLLESRATAFILQGKDLAVEIRESCHSCRRFKAKLTEVEMGKIHPSRLTIAPAFYYSQVDLLGPFTAICEHNHRSSVKVWGLVFKDPTTTAISVHVVQRYDTAAFLQAYTRFVSRYGHPFKLFIDEGSQLLKGCKEMKYDLTDLTNTINSKHNVGIVYETCPVGGHNVHGIVERAVKEVRSVFERVYAGLRLDILSYETAFAWTSAELNNLPICLGSAYKNLDHTDLITPSRLLIGRNNRRAPAGPVVFDTPSKLIDQMEKVKEAWWKVWRDEKLEIFVPQPPKWRRNSEEVKPGDIVVFVRDQKDGIGGNSTWRMGRIQSVEKSQDGFVRTAIIEYKNASESVFRTTRRSVRKIAVLHREGDLELVDKLNKAAKLANTHFLMSVEF